MAGLLLPSDPLNARRPDDAFGREVQAIETLGIPIDLLDLDALLAGSATRAVHRVGPSDVPLLYRGWMMPVARYAELAVALDGCDASLVTAPAAYAATHHLPLAYEALAGVTPRTVWVEGTDRVDFARVHEALSAFGHAPVVVKDFVKSRKHEWLEACFIPDAGDRAGVERVVGTFVERQARTSPAGSCSASSWSSDVSASTQRADWPWAGSTGPSSPTASCSRRVATGTTSTTRTTSRSRGS